MVETATDPLALSAMTVLLPNRRACRAMQEAFPRLGASGGRALMLPRLMPLGDLDEGELSLQGLALDLGLGEALSEEVPPAISPLRRQMLLAELVQRAATATLTANPKDAKLHRALWHTYLEPAPTQERAAELLGLPFNTYRYHLSKGIERVADWLWQRELAGS